VWNASRKPLAGQFKFNGTDVFVIANHFDSKLGDQSQDGRFQYPAQSSAVQRAGQAQVEHNFINQILAIDKKADVVVVGDLNDYQFSPALSILKTGTSDGSGKATLTDLITTLPANQQYTYDFDGLSEVLDHILVSKGIGKYTYQVVHVNAEFANQVSDHDPRSWTSSPDAAHACTTEQAGYRGWAHSPRKMGVRAHNPFGPRTAVASVLAGR
jgi:predicted extracellular nuclease